MLFSSFVFPNACYVRLRNIYVWLFLVFVVVGCVHSMLFCCVCAVCSDAQVNNTLHLLCSCHNNQPGYFEIGLLLFMCIFLCFFPMKCLSRSFSSLSVVLVFYFQICAF